MSHWEKALDKVREIAEPLARTMGFEVLLVEEASEPGRRVVRVFLDKPGMPEGVTVDECARFSRALDPILDVEGELEGRYHLEVSSPGLNRPLVKLEHFREQIGKMVQVTAEPGLGERKNFKGVLEGVEGEGEAALIIIKVDQTEFSIPWKNIKRAHLDFFATESTRPKEKRK